jgi:hypothetical protein
MCNGRLFDGKFYYDLNAGKNLKLAPGIMVSMPAIAHCLPLKV